MISDQSAPEWENLHASKEKYFREGVIFKFRTNDTIGDHFKYALGVRLDLAEDLSFVGLDGRTWGYGNSMLPIEARFEGRKYTLSQPWIANNFIFIAEPSDPSDIWVCLRALSLFRQFDENS